MKGRCFECDRWRQVREYHTGDGNVFWCIQCASRLVYDPLIERAAKLVKEADSE